MAAAATMAIVIDSSIVMRRSRRFSKASLRIGQPPIRRPSDADHADRGNGSQTRNQTAAAASATTAMRAASIHRELMLVIMLVIVIIVMMVMLVMVVVVPMWDVLRDRTRLSEIGWRAAMDVVLNCHSGGILVT